MAIMVILSVLMTGCGGKKAETKEQEAVISVKSEAVQKRDIVVNSNISGKLEPIEVANLSPKTFGKVTSVNNLEIGKRVSAGQVLFTLDAKDFQNGVNSAKANYEAAVANLNSIVEHNSNAQLNRDRMKSLYNEGAISKQQLEQSELAASGASVESARAQVNVAMANLENAKSNLSDTTVISPINGVITAYSVHTGEVASSSMPCVSIANCDKVVVNFNLSENLIGKVKIGDIVDVAVKSAEKSFKGKISALSPATSGKSMTYPVKIELDNKDKDLKAGMFAEISIVSEKKEKVVAISSNAPMTKDGSTVVFTIKNNRAHMNKVSLGTDNGKFVEVKSGLKEGDVVVNKGQNYLEENSKVKNN